MVANRVVGCSEWYNGKFDSLRSSSLKLILGNQYWYQGKIWMKGISQRF